MRNAILEIFKLCGSRLTGDMSHEWSLVLGVADYLSQVLGRRDKAAAWRLSNLSHPGRRMKCHRHSEVGQPGEKGHRYRNDR